MTISGPGSTAGPTSVAVSSASGISSLFVAGINTSSGGNWLCAVASGTSVNVYVGGNNCSVATSTTQLAANQTYSGTVSVTGNGGALTGSFTVNLSVGNIGGGGAGVSASPNQVTFNAVAGGQVNSQVVQVFFNGSPQTITGFSFTPTSGVAFLNTIVNGTQATLSVNNTSLGNGTYTGTETFNTIFGSVNVPVTLTIGGGGSSGVVASPSAVSFVASPGGQVASQNVAVTVNGAATSINGFSFTPTSGGVSFVNTAINGSIATLSVNNTNLGNGTYTGIETLNTVFGSATVQVTLTIGSGTSGLAANPNPLNVTAQTGVNPTTQNVTITANGSAANVTSVSASTTTGQPWLNPFVSGTIGTVSVNIQSSGLSAGSYSGTVNVGTLQGNTSFQVNLTVGGTPAVQANPSALSFAYQTGAGVPPAQTVSVTTTGTPVNYTTSSFINSGNVQWLIVSPQGQGSTPGSITVSIQPVGLQPGSYSGTIQLSTFGGSSNPVINIPVSLLVSTSPILSFTPTSINFTAQQGTTPPSQILTVQSSSSQISFNVTGTVQTPAGFNWLQIPSQFGSTPGTIPINVTTAGLSPGTYTGAVTVSSQTAGNPSTSIPVNLTITAGSTLQLVPPNLSFAYQIGQAQPVSQTVTVNSPSQTSYTLFSQVSSGPNWLILSSTSGSAPGSFTVSVNPSGLSAGAYNGTITVTPTNGTPQTMQVTLVVSTTSLLVTSPSGVNFTAQQGTGVVTPGSQNVAVTSTDGTPINFGVNVTYSSGASGWLFVNTSTGVTPSNLTVSANPSNLGAGTYTATITLTATSGSVANSPQVITVTMTVSAGGTVAVTPTALTFTQAFGGAAPASQTLSVSGSGNFTAAASTNVGGAWLSVSPTSGFAPATLTVSVNPVVNGLFLQAGTYTGQVTVTGSNFQQQTVSVTFTVTTTGGGSLPGSGSMAQIASGGSWTTTITLVNNGASATPVRLNFFDDNGNPLSLAISFPQTSPGSQILSSVDRTLNPGAVLLVSTTGPDNQQTQTGWAQLQSSGSVTGFAVFTQTVAGTGRQQEAVVAVDTRTSGSYVVYFDNTESFATGIAAANVSGGFANIPVTIRDENGTVITFDNLSLPARGHIAFSVATRFPITAQRRGTIEFQTPAGGQISVLGLRFNPAQAFTSIPPLPK